MQEISPVAYRVPPGRPGWVTVGTTFQEGWYLDGEAAVPTAEGTMMFPVGAAGGVVRFRPWGLAKLGYAISTGAFIVVAAAAVVWDRRRSTGGRGRERRPGHEGPWGAHCRRRVVMTNVATSVPGESRGS